MAAISLFLDNDMADVRSREKTLYTHVNLQILPAPTLMSRRGFCSTNQTVDLEFCLTIILTSSFEEGLSRKTC